MSPSLVNSSNALKKSRKFVWVDPRVLHPSKVLPKRDFSSELVELIRRDGVQQPIIVRPSHKNGMFEIIDGHLRHRSIRDYQKVLVDVRYDLEDTQVFKVSEATFTRKPRNTYERALFYSSWVRTVEAKYGSRGAQTKVAKMASLSEAEVSHYLSISRFFERLRSHNVAEINFNALKNQSVNKLYAIAKVQDKPAMLEVAERMAENPNMTLKELKDVIEEQTSPMRAIERLIDEDDEEGSENIRISQLTSAAKELEFALDNAREVLTIFTSRIVGNPRRFISPHVLKRIRTMLNAVKKIEKEANRIIRSGKKANRLDK